MLGKIVLDDMSKRHGAVATIRAIIRQELGATGKRHPRLCWFLSEQDTPPMPFAEKLLIGHDRFNIDIIRQLSDDSLCRYASDVAGDLERIANAFHASTVGMNLFHLDSVAGVFRTVLSRCYKAISADIVNAELNKCMKRLGRSTCLISWCSATGNMINAAEKMESNGVLRFAAVAVSLVEAVLRIYGSDTSVFQTNVLSKVYYEGIAQKRKHPPRRPKHVRVHHKKRKTWRDKRPPRICTDFDVQMPEIANKRRHKRLDKMMT